MSHVRFVFALHNHQPIGNFDSVFEASFRESYGPYLELMEQYTDLSFVLHTSGPLLEWLVANRPGYVDALKRLVAHGRVEILGGAFHEPILANIPRRDRVGQIRAYSAYLEQLFGQKVRGMWLPERVWEQSLASSLAEAGIEYTMLDDFHFEQAGLPREALTGYYLTEDDGHVLKVFPNSERMRYLTPWREPHESYLYLKQVAEATPGAVVVCGDDGEKFGAWPQTFDHVYTHGWLRRFCDMLRASRSWIETTTLSRAVDETLPRGKVYLPDASYREMAEWALSPERFHDYQATLRDVRGLADCERMRNFVRPGGFWRNFRARYPESDEMYCRMVGISRRIEELESRDGVDRHKLARAREHLYRAQCNCAYWHGAFGGLYLPHLRNAVYQNLIAAHGALDAVEGRTGSRVSADVGDFNLDARQEVKLENDRLIAWIRPAQGGQLYELDDRHTHTNLLATLDRRPEAYHETIVRTLGGSSDAIAAPASATPQVLFKHEALDRMLVYDRHPRKAFVDHVYAPGVRSDDLTACSDIELGDFVCGAYLGQLETTAGSVAVMMERTGWADGRRIRVYKTIELHAGERSLVARYRLDDLSRDCDFLWAVEINIAAMAAPVVDRYYADEEGRVLGLLDAVLDLGSCETIELRDHWRDLAATLRWNVPAALWCFPVRTVSQSEGGFEAVYQSSAVIPHWRVKGERSPSFEVEIRLDLATIEPARPAATARARVAVEA